MYGGYWQWMAVINLAGALLAGWMGYLTPGAALWAAAVGIAVGCGGGLVWFLLLLAFFVTATFLTQLGKETREEKEKQRRNWLQVLANGGAGAVLALLYGTAGNYPAFFIAFVGAVAAVNADTWATEIGTRWGGKTRLLWGWREVPAGVSGGVSLGGTLAGVAGAAFIGLVAEAGQLFLGMPILPYGLAMKAALAGGIVGFLGDSLAGARLQGCFRCQRCGKIVESSVHCRWPAELISGYRGVDNNAVNFICSLLGAAGALGGAWLLLWISYAAARF